MGEEYKYKIITLGEMGVGKTCLTSVFTRNKFPDDVLNTVGIDFQTKRIKIDDVNVCVSIWDTSGQEKFYTLTKQYFRNADGILFVFDLTSVKSMKKICDWKEKFDSMCENRNYGMVLVGNKADNVENIQISDIEANNFAKEMELDYYKTSAKDKMNVNEAFEHLIRNIIKAKKGKNDIEVDCNVMNLNIKKKKLKNCNC